MPPFGKARLDLDADAANKVDQGTSLTVISVLGRANYPTVVLDIARSVLALFPHSHRLCVVPVGRRWVAVVGCLIIIIGGSRCYNLLIGCLT